MLASGIMSGLLKRKFEEVYKDDPCYSSSSLSSSAYSGWDSEGESCYSDSLDSTPSNPGSPDTQCHTTSILKNGKRVRCGRGNVTFDMVTVFLFPRCQGFSSVPSRGGCSLGMVQKHSSLRRYTLTEYAVAQRTLRKEKLLTRLREEKLEALKQKLTKGGTVMSEEADRLTLEDIPEVQVDISGCNLDSSSFLQPYPSRRRHALLKAAGVKKIDKEEKRELHELRVSREDCGCDCQGFCEPETCACSLAGIKCQMDHSTFPCGCTKDGCGNTEGRIEFNSSRVQTHYIHTIMKLELEKRLEETSGPGYAPSGSTHNSLADLPSITDGPSFHFSSGLAAVGENSCGSDMTDSSSSSRGSDDSQEGVGLERDSQEGGSLLDVDENGLRRILRFSEVDNDNYNINNHVVNDNRCFPNQTLQQPSSTSVLGFSTDDFPDENDNGEPSSTSVLGFSTADFPDENDNVESALLQERKDLHTTPVSELLDYSANEANGLFHHHEANPPSPFVERPNTPSPSTDRTAASYMDLSLSSESDLEFFDGFPCLGPSSLYSSLKDYEHMDNFFQFQLPSYPSSHSLASDPGTCLLESLIGLSESIPEPPATFTDNQLLEEAVRG
ncbi:cysteine/serine-rich nuclear protein 1b [Esox lucius]|nr:cysteine/serine-rich nuclear protein 1b [Esox lucius]XP_010896440.2 cysteine/serine-rich nuclear protein 1b [Esox lucius]XP_010896441.2 cysteine/serine-rich nuclear protein 1b [Esox lucius]